MKKKIFLTTLFIAVAVITIMPLSAQACYTRSVEIEKWLRCQGGAGYTSDPPYLVGEKYYFWIVYEVNTTVDLTDVVVYDRFGAELMIEGIATNWATTVLDPLNNDTDPTNDVYDYYFDYNPYARDGEVLINDVFAGHLDKDGVTFDGFHIFWTGNSVKAHFQWNVGDMDAGTWKRIWVIVSTDTNPAGKQEYTSGGRHILNSGATVKARIAATGRRVSAVSNTIVIEVEGGYSVCWIFRRHRKRFSFFHWWIHH